MDLLLAAPASPCSDISCLMTFSARERPTPRASRKALVAAVRLPASTRPAPLTPPNMRPAASEKGCVGNRGIISASEIAAVKARAPSGPRASMPSRKDLNSSTGTVSEANAAGASSSVAATPRPTEHRAATGGLDADERLFSPSALDLGIARSAPTAARPGQRASARRGGRPRRAGSAPVRQPRKAPCRPLQVSSPLVVALHETLGGIIKPAMGVDRGPGGKRRRAVLREAGAAGFPCANCAAPALHVMLYYVDKSTFPRRTPFWCLPPARRPRAAI
mmetsp:Transcript_1364/g.3219  ORF Transcript_1364/g.3219 Transcript_1364/m.3219 type:complete len:277 (-) Transcript_1364:95-925(-)